jgi:hypothetical protein
MVRSGAAVVNIVQLAMKTGIVVCSLLFFKNVLGMSLECVPESFYYTVEHDSVTEVQRFVEAYGKQIDHQTWCVGLHKAIVRGELELVIYMIKQGGIDVATENLGSYYKTGNKPLMALGVVQFMLDNIHYHDDASCYAAIKAYIQQLMPVVGDQDYGASLPMKRHCSYTNKTSWLVAGSFLCWLLYCVTMYSKGAVPSA